VYLNIEIYIYFFKKLVQKKDKYNKDTFLKD